jgi:hypothetical protein
MATQYELTILSVKKAPVINDISDVVTRINFQYVASDQGKSYLYMGRIKLPEPENTEGFIPISELTEEKVKEWILKETNEDILKERVDRELQKIISPPESDAFFEWLPDTTPVVPLSETQEEEMPQAEPENYSDEYIAQQEGREV